MGKISDYFVRNVDLPKEVMKNIPFITLSGKEEIIIENYKGIIEYSDDTMRINTSVGVMKIYGKNLLLNQITSENIKITGTICKVEYLL